MRRTNRHPGGSQLSPRAVFPKTRDLNNIHREIERKAKRRQLKGRSNE